MQMGERTGLAASGLAKKNARGGIYSRFSLRDRKHETIIGAVLTALGLKRQPGRAAAWPRARRPAQQHRLPQPHVVAQVDKALLPVREARISLAAGQIVEQEHLHDLVDVGRAAIVTGAGGFFVDHGDVPQKGLGGLGFQLLVDHDGARPQVPNRIGPAIIDHHRVISSRLAAASSVPDSRRSPRSINCDARGEAASADQRPTSDLVDQIEIGKPLDGIQLRRKLVGPR